jgi:histidinol phosphatase-like PHP family hydrolase
MNMSRKSGAHNAIFPNLIIKLALEVDFLPGHQEWIRELAARHPWDYFIGSVHYVSDSWAVDNPKHMSQMEKPRSVRSLVHLFRTPGPGGGIGVV